MFRSNRHIVLQVIDDTTGRTLAAASTVEADVRGAGSTGNVAAATKVGDARRPSGPRPPASPRSCSTGVASCYHGRVAAVADAAREAGLEF